jgi:hypothetical protein
MGSSCWHFRFVGHAIDSNLTTSEGISTSHDLVQSRNYRISCAKVLVLNKKI